MIFAAAVIYATASLISSSWGPLALVWDMGLDPVGFYIAFYACAVLAFTALFFLNKLLSNISRGKVFIGENVKLIRILSWCCYLVGIVLAVYSIWAYPFIVIAAAAAFFSRSFIRSVWPLMIFAAAEKRLCKGCANSGRE